MNITIPLADGRVYQAIIGESTVKLWRKPHDLEINDYDAKDRVWAFSYRGDGNHSGPIRDTVKESQKGMPEVYRLYPDHITALDCRWVTFWRNLNPMLTVRSFSSLMGSELAWMNNTGSPPRYNCLTGEGSGNPAFDAARICGGALLKPKAISGETFYIEGLLTSDPTPDPVDVLKNKPWLWYYGTTILPSGKINYITRQDKNGNFIPVRIPILSREQLWVPIKWLDDLPPNFNITNYDSRTLF